MDSVEPHTLSEEDQQVVKQAISVLSRAIQGSQSQSSSNSSSHIPIPPDNQTTSASGNQSSQRTSCIVEFACKFFFGLILII